MSGPREERQTEDRRPGPLDPRSPTFTSRLDKPTEVRDEEGLPSVTTNGKCSEQCRRPNKTGVESRPSASVYPWVHRTKAHGTFLKSPIPSPVGSTRDLDPSRLTRKCPITGPLSVSLHPSLTRSRPSSGRSQGARDSVRRSRTKTFRLFIHLPLRVGSSDRRETPRSRTGTREDPETNTDINVVIGLNYLNESWTGVSLIGSVGDPRQRRKSFS